MSKSSPRVLQELMTAVDAGHAVDVYVDSSRASSDSRTKLLGPRHRRSTYYGRGAGGARKSAPAVALAVAAAKASSDASFEFSTGVNSYSSASPASMVFSDGQLRAHQFPAVRASVVVSTGSSHSVSRGSSQSTSPLRNSSIGSSYSSSTKQHSSQSTSPLRSPSVGSSYSISSTKPQQAGVTGSKKRVTFATDDADTAAVVGKAGGGQQGKKSGGLLRCMGSACGMSSRHEAVEPVARNVNRKVVAF